MVGLSKDFILLAMIKLLGVGFPSACCFVWMRYKVYMIEVFNSFYYGLVRSKSTFAGACVR